MKSCKFPDVMPELCTVREPDYKAAILSIPVMKGDCKDEITFIKRLLREKRLLHIECSYIHTVIIGEPEYEITVTYRSREHKKCTLIF